MRRIKDTSIQHLAIGVVLSLNLLSITVVIITFLFLTDKGVEIDISGRNRMLSQRMVLFANLYVNGDKDARQIALETMNLHQASIESMKRGGNAPEMNNARLKPAKGEALEKLKMVESFWQKYKENLSTVINEPLYWKDETVNDNLVKAFVSQSKGRETNITFFLVICISINLLTLLSSYFTVRLYLVKPIQKLSKISHELAQGRYEQEILEESKNEIGLLASSLNLLFLKFEVIFEYIEQLGEKKYKYQIEEKHKYLEDNKIIRALLKTSSKLEKEEDLKKQQNWIDNGLSHFADLMRNNANDLQALCQTFVSDVCSYVEIPQGAIFVLNDEKEDDLHLELVAAYAISKDKILKRKVKIYKKSAEGLIGQVFLEKNKLIITNTGDTVIASGMGKAKAKFIALLPIYTRQEGLGILELISFRTLDTYQINFIEKITNDLAITIQTLRTNLKTERLYQNSQDMTERMLQQEENMRQQVEQITANYMEVEMELNESQEKLRNTNILNQVVKVIEKHLEIPEFLEEVRKKIPSAFLQDVNVKITYKNWVLEDKDQETSNVCQEAFFQDIAYQNGKIAVYDLRGAIGAGFFKIDEVTFLQNISTLIEGYINTRLGQNKYKTLNNAQKNWRKEREQLVFDLENTLNNYEKMKNELEIIKKNENNKIKAFKKKEKDLLLRITELENYIKDKK